MGETSSSARFSLVLEAPSMHVLQAACNLGCDLGGEPGSHAALLGDVLLEAKVRKRGNVAGEKRCLTMTVEPEQ